jgi:hypothetical protein
MKITKRQLRRIIKEEKAGLQSELRAVDRQDPEPTEADLILNKFYVDVDALASSVGFIPLSRESISDKYTLEDYISDLSHQLRGAF